tara:strand:- start:2123 stop:2383 length:261 start_codon:yes stop_codon:yes gene_type:complete
MSKPTINNIKLNLIGSWNYNIINKECAYCKLALNQSSPEMYEKGESSNVIVNVCGHGFHHECISKWLQKSNNCPICINEWKKDLYK